jgi:hypothetical protein
LEIIIKVERKKLWKSEISDQAAFLLSLDATITGSGSVQILKVASYGDLTTYSRCGCNTEMNIQE